MFPPVFGQLARVGGTRGLVISVIAVLLLAYFVDLTAIASLGSAVALAIFLITSIGAYRLRAETGSRASVLIVGILLTIVVFLVFRSADATNRTLDIRCRAGVLVAVGRSGSFTWFRDSTACHYRRVTDRDSRHRMCLGAGLGWAGYRLWQTPTASGVLASDKTTRV
jgi:hypothetical protein